VAIKYQNILPGPLWHKEKLLSRLKIGYCSPLFFGTAALTIPVPAGASPGPQQPAPYYIPTASQEGGEIAVLAPNIGY